MYIYINTEHFNTLQIAQNAYFTHTHSKINIFTGTIFEIKALIGKNGPFKNGS